MLEFTDRLLSFHAEGEDLFGVLRADNSIVVLSDNTMLSLRAALEMHSAEALMEMAKARPADFVRANVQFLSVIPMPEKIICVGANFPTELQKLPEKPAFPTLFVRFANTLVAHDAPMQIPAASATLDFEGELALVVGRGGRNIDPDNALEALAGFTCFNDGTVRGWQGHSHQFTPAKNFPATGSLGPVLLPCTVVDDYRQLRLETRINGEIVQSDTMASMIFDVGEIVAYCSTFTHLQPGDVIACGSPDGFGATRKPPLYLQPGDVVEVEIENIGCLSNPVIAEPST